MLKEYLNPGTLHPRNYRDLKVARNKYHVLSICFSLASSTSYSWALKRSWHVPPKLDIHWTTPCYISGDRENLLIREVMIPSEHSTSLSCLCHCIEKENWLFIMKFLGIRKSAVWHLTCSLPAWRALQSLYAL
jgi:hypothetical protein